MQLIAEEIHFQEGGRGDMNHTVIAHALLAELNDHFAGVLDDKENVLPPTEECCARHDGAAANVKSRMKNCKCPVIVLQRYE